MIDWKNEKPEIEVLSWENFPYEQLNIPLDELYGYLNRGKIFFKPQIWDFIWEYGRSSMNELGGLLLGYVYERNSNYLWYVDDIVVNDDYEHSSFHLILYSSLWQKANDKILNKNFIPEKFILGWFHTHPNFKPFFSSIDKKTHQHFFSYDYSLGIVIDPFSKEMATYLGSSLKVYSEEIFIVDLFKEDKS